MRARLVMRFFEPACLFLKEMLAHEVVQRLALAFGEQHGAAHRVPRSGVESWLRGERNSNLAGSNAGVLWP